jgi:hypothetical protein
VWNNTGHATAPSAIKQKQQSPLKAGFVEELWQVPGLVAEARFELATFGL